MMPKDKNHNLVKRGETWYFRKKVNGRRFKKALASNLTEARRKRDELLQEIELNGQLVQEQRSEPSQMLFGEVAQLWAKVVQKRLKSSTYRDYRSAMNFYILDRFGKRPE